MSEVKFPWVNFFRWILVFPAAIAGIVVWATIAEHLPPVGEELYLVSMYPPDHLYNVYLDSFMDVFASLMFGALMAPKYRREVVVVGILMMGGCGGLADAAFWQSHFAMPHRVSVWSYVMSGIASLLAVWGAHCLDQRSRRHAERLSSSKLAAIDESDALSQVAGQ